MQYLLLLPALLASAFASKNSQTPTGHTSADSFLRAACSVGPPMKTVVCDGGSCGCNPGAAGTIVCPTGSRAVCGRSAQFCCPSAQQPLAQPFQVPSLQPLLSKPTRLPPLLQGFGGMGMGMGMGGMGMPGNLCGCGGGGGGCRSLMGGMGGGMMGMCGGGSMCQAPMFTGFVALTGSLDCAGAEWVGLLCRMNQQLMFQRQMQMMMMQQRMMAPRLGMSIRVCTCPPGSYSLGGQRAYPMQQSSTLSSPELPCSPPFFVSALLTSFPD